jgi:hypothetical protein
MARRGSAGRGEDALGRGLRLAAPVVAAILAAAALSGCGAISSKFSEAGSQMPGIGLPSGAPERTAERTAFPAVHDLPPPRNSVTLTSIERAEAERQLLEARNEQQTAGASIKAGSDDPRDQKETQKEKDQKEMKERLRKARMNQ